LIVFSVLKKDLGFLSGVFLLENFFNGDGRYSFGSEFFFELGARRASVMSL
jgi:hypothetical protein